jgi:hypothetical protein
VKDVSVIGLYFVLVFYFVYLLSSDKEVIYQEKYRNIIRNGYFVPLFSALILSIYVVLIVYFNYSAIAGVSGSRSLQSTLNTQIEMLYKVKPVFVLLVVLVSYLFLSSRRLSSLVFLSPFVVYDILLSGRSYMFSVAMLVLVLMVLTGKAPKIKIILISAGVISSVAIFRIGAPFDIEFLKQPFLEFFFTWSTVELIHQSETSMSLSSALAYALLRILPSFVYELVAGNYISYTDISSRANPLGWGLAGSIVAEAVAFKNDFILVVYPFFLAFYFLLVNFLLRHSYLGFYIFILVIIYIQPIFRYSFLEFALYPFYILMFPALLFVLFFYCSSRLRVRNGNRYNTGI